MSKKNADTMPLKIRELFRTSENSQKYIDRKIDTISQEIDDAHQFADDSKFPTLQEYNAVFQGT